MGGRADFEGGFFWDRLNVHTFDSRHRADRRFEGWLRRDGWGGCEEWVDGWMGGFKEWVDG